MHYRLDAALDDATGVVSGTAEILYRHLGPDTLRSLTLSLGLNAFRPGARGWPARAQTAPDATGFARILEIRLDDDDSFGVDWNAIMSGRRGTLDARQYGFANEPTPGLHGFFATISTKHLDAFLDALAEVVRFKALAAPQVLALEGHEAQIIVGGKLGFYVTTTTQTSTIQPAAASVGAPSRSTSKLRVIEVVPTRPTYVATRSRSSSRGGWKNSLCTAFRGRKMS